MGKFFLLDFYLIRFFSFLLRVTICMPPAGFLVARFKWLNYIQDWPAPRILWQLKWREILYGECPIHTVLWLFNILKFVLIFSYFEFYNAMQCAMTKFKNLRYKKNEVIPELFYFKVRVYMEFAQNHRKNERRVVQFCLHLRIQYIFDFIQFLEFPTLYSHLLRLNVLRFR